MQKSQNLKALILGGSGAIGRDLIKELLSSPEWSEVTVIVRRKLEEWDQFDETQKNKLKIVIQESLDSLEEVSKWNFEGYSSIFLCLGSLRKHGKEMFTKVEYTYPLYGCKLASHFKIPHCGYLSGWGVDSKSWNYQVKTKGQTEDALKASDIDHVCLMRPGILLERRNDERLIEKIFNYVPFVPKIKAPDVAKAFRNEAELWHRGEITEKRSSYENADIQYLADHAKIKPKK